MNSKTTSERMASLAAEVLRDADASDIAKRLAGSALSQAASGRQTGADLEELAGRVLSAEKYAATTRELAATVLSQANKAR